MSSLFIYDKPKECLKQWNCGRPYLVVIATLIRAKHDGIRRLVVEVGLKTNNETHSTVTCNVGLQID